MPYQWDEDRQRYLYPSGRLVPPSVLNRALERVVRQGNLRMRSMTEALQDGTLSLADWQTRMASEMKLLHTGAAAFGRGGWKQMSQSDWGWTGQQIRQQYNYLRNFASDIATGRQPMNGRVIARAGLYAEAARGTTEGMRRKMAQFLGREEERNQLGASDRHCTQCVECSSRGWVPIGTLPQPGARSCLSNCHCHLVYRDTRELAAA